MSCTDVPNDSSCPTAGTSKDILTQEPEITVKSTQVLEHCYSKDVANVEENIEIEEEKSELDREPAETTEYPTQDFDTVSELQRMNATAIRNGNIDIPPHESCIVMSGEGHAY